MSNHVHGAAGINREQSAHTSIQARLQALADDEPQHKAPAMDGAAVAVGGHPVPLPSEDCPAGPQSYGPLC